VYYTLAPQEARAGGSGCGLGLFVLDVATGQVVTFLDENNVILAVSPDQTFVAFLAAEQTPPEVRIARLDGTSTVLFQPVSGARAVLGAAFSPDSSRIVWVTIINEAGIGESWQLSLASTFGGPTSQMDLRSLIPADLPPVRSSYPVAWITDTSILLQVEREGSSSVTRYQVDAGDLGPAVAGVFISLFYP
jgi:hypothetical protein